MAVPTPTAPASALPVSTDALAARTSAWLAAKAKAEASDVEVIAITEDTYRVLGGNDYTVTRNGLQFTCNCPAGSHGRPCYHAAKVALLPHEAHHRATVRAALAEAARQTRPACPGYLKEHAAREGVISFWCAQCDEEAVAA